MPFIKKKKKAEFICWISNSSCGEKTLIMNLQWQWVIHVIVEGGASPQEGVSTDSWCKLLWGKTNCGSCDFCLTMNTSVPSLLLVLWLKSCLNWLVVVIQRHYMIRTFSGFFCISLALIDSLLSFALTAIFFLEDVNISGWRFTRYYICLLTQITCFIYDKLHWPVFLLVGLSNFWTLSSSSTNTSWTQKLAYIAGVCLLWMVSALYVFWVPDVAPLLGDDEKHQCRLSSSPQCSQVLTALVLTAACIIIYSYAPFEKWRVQVFLHSTQQSCLVCLRSAMQTFFSTWVSFLILMTISPLLRVEMHAHLQLNVIWLSFLNSFSVALALTLAPHARKSETITDGFCSWYSCVTYRADERNYGQQTDQIQVKTWVFILEDALLSCLHYKKETK